MIAGDSGFICNACVVSSSSQKDPASIAFAQLADVLGRAPRP